MTDKIQHTAGLGGPAPFCRLVWRSCPHLSLCLSSLRNEPFSGGDRGDPRWRIPLSLQPQDMCAKNQTRAHPNSPTPQQRALNPACPRISAFCGVREDRKGQRGWSGLWRSGELGARSRLWAAGLQEKECLCTYTHWEGEAQVRCSKATSGVWGPEAHTVQLSAPLTTSSVTWTSYLAWLNLFLHP